ncbi:MAG: toxin-activating lysine-acyltransferase [Rhizobiales bacterium]|nr:toxin-activating lysine-acyltransferase [Hyphomicrobiales bacterium]
MVPVILQQFRLFYDKDKPIGLVLYAHVDDKVEERLTSGNALFIRCGKSWVHRDNSLRKSNGKPIGYQR